MHRGPEIRKKQFECGFGSSSPSLESQAYTPCLLPSRDPEHCLRPYNIFCWVNGEQLSLVCQSILFPPESRKLTSYPSNSWGRWVSSCFLPGISLQEEREERGCVLAVPAVPRPRGPPEGGTSVHIPAASLARMRLLKRKITAALGFHP